MLWIRHPAFSLPGPCSRRLFAGAPGCAVGVISPVSLDDVRALCLIVSLVFFYWKCLCSESGNILCAGKHCSHRFLADGLCQIGGDSLPQTALPVFSRIPLTRPGRRE